MCSATGSTFRRLLAAVMVLATGTCAALAQENSSTTPRPTPAAKKASIYDKTADTQVQVEKAMERAKHDDKRILVMFGGDWCGWCHKLHELFREQRRDPQAIEL